jgi:hypothetical protein
MLGLISPACLTSSTVGSTACARLTADDFAPEFTNMWESAFDVTDTTFDCNVNRSKGDASTELFLINHFLDTVVLGQPAPDPQDANVTNAVSGTGSLGVQVQTCVAAHGRNPNFMLVDVRIYCLLLWRQLSLCSSTSLAVEVSSRWRPLLMVSPIARQRR